MASNKSSNYKGAFGGELLLTQSQWDSLVEPVEDKDGNITACVLKPNVGLTEPGSSSQDFAIKALVDGVEYPAQLVNGVWCLNLPSSGTGGDIDTDTRLTNARVIDASQTDGVDQIVFDLVDIDGNVIGSESFFVPDSTELPGGELDTDTYWEPTLNADGTYTFTEYDEDGATGNSLTLDQDDDSTVVQVDAAFIAMYGDTDTTGATVAVGEWVQLNDDDTFHCLDVKVATVEYIKGEIVEGVQQMTRSLLDENGNVIRNEQFGVNNSPILYAPGEQLPSGAPIMSVPVVDLPDMSTYRFESFNSSLGQVIPANYKGCIAWDVCKGKAARLDAPKRPQLVFTAPKDVAAPNGPTWFDYLSGLTDAQLAEIDILRVNGTLVPDVRCYTSYVDENGIEWTATEGVGWFSSSTAGGAGSVSEFSPVFDGTGPGEVLIGTHSDGAGNDVEVYAPASSTLTKDALLGLVPPTCKFTRIDTDGDGISDGWEITVNTNGNQTVDGFEFSFDGVTFGPMASNVVSEAEIPGWADQSCIWVRPIVTCDGLSIPVDCKLLPQPCKGPNERLFPAVQMRLSVCMLFNDDTSPTAATNWGPNFPEQNCLRFEGLSNVPGNRTINAPQIEYTNDFDCPVELCATHATWLHYRSETGFGDTTQPEYTFDTILGEFDAVENIVVGLSQDFASVGDGTGVIGDGTRVPDRNISKIGAYCPADTGSVNVVYAITHQEEFKCVLQPGESTTISTAQILSRGSDGVGPDRVRFHHRSEMAMTVELLENKV